MWKTEGGGCGHADVATVTAVSSGLELQGSRLEKRGEEDDSRRIQMRPRSLPVDPVSYPITTAARGRGERRARGCRRLHRECRREGGIFRCRREPFRRTPHVCVSRLTPTPVIACLTRQRLWKKSLFICSFKRIRVRQLNISSSL